MRFSGWDYGLLNGDNYGDRAFVNELEQKIINEIAGMERQHAQALSLADQAMGAKKSLEWALIEIRKTKESLFGKEKNND